MSCQRKWCLRSAFVHHCRHTKGKETSLKMSMYLDVSQVFCKIGLLQKTTDPPEFFESRHPVALLWSWRKKKNKKKKEEEKEEEEDTISRVMSNTIPITSKNQTTPNTVKEYARIRVFFDILH